MIILITIICLIPIIITLLIGRNERKKDKYYDFEDLIFNHIFLLFFDIVTIIAVAICSFAIIYFADEVVAGNVIDEKIQVAQTQNAEIEEKVKTVVEKYLNYESGTYKELKPEEIIVAAAIYPELQSNQIVQEQIKVYEENNKKIVSLKEEKINVKIARWWLYFGN